MSFGSAVAQGSAPGPTTPSLRWSGFGTLGLTYHDNDDVGAIFSYSQRSPAEHGLSGNLDTVLGLQADAQLASSTSATVQAVTRAGDDFRPKLRMAYLRQQLGQDFGLRLGRIRSPLYLDSDVSEVGFAYLAARPSPPLYNVAGNYVPHIDGGDLQWRHAFGNTAVLVQAYAGRSENKQILYNTSPEQEADIEFSGIRGLALNVSLPAVSLRVSRTWIDRFTLRSSQVDQLNGGLAQINAGLLGAAANPLLPDAVRAALNGQAAAVQGYTNAFDSRPVYTSLGFDANLKDWRLTGEWAEFDSRSRMVGKYRGFNATLGYAIGNFTPYVAYSKNRRVSSSLDTSALSATGLDPTLDAALGQMQGALNQAALFTDLTTRARTVGVRWDYGESIAIKFQYDRFTTPSSNSPGIFAVRSLPIDNKLDLVSVTLDFVF